MSNLQVKAPFIPGTVDTPLDARTRIATLADVGAIDLPYVGMTFYVTGTQKRYLVKSLKSKTIGSATVANAAIDAYEELQRGDMKKSVYDADGDGVVDQAKAALSIGGKSALEVAALVTAAEKLPLSSTSYSNRMLAVGFHNVAGGVPLRVTAIDGATLTLEAASDDLTAGEPVLLHLSRYDNDSPRTVTVSAVDGVTVTLSEAPAYDGTLENSDADPILLILPEMTADEWDDDQSGYVAGDNNINTAITAVVLGSCNVNIASYAVVSGLCNYNTGEGATISGANNVNLHGEQADIGGSGNRLLAADGYGRYTFMRGNGNTAASDGIVIFGGGNYVTGMNAVVLGNGNGSETAPISGRDAFGAGSGLKLTGDRSKAIGRTLTVNAADALLVGMYGELPDSPENEGAFAVAGGETGAPVLGFTVRTRKKVANPLYTDGTDGEPQYNAEPAFRTTYRGQVKPESQNIAIAAATTVTLDADQYSRWMLAGSGTATLTLENWQDGDKGELVIDTSVVTPVIPADWVTLGADITTTPGLYVLEIAQVGSTVFYAIRYPLSAGAGEKGDKGDTGSVTVVESGTEPANPADGTIWIYRD